MHELNENVAGIVIDWIEQTLDQYSSKRFSCLNLRAHLKNYYPEEFLANSYYVVIEHIPKPDLPELRQAGLGSFIDDYVDGITYKNTLSALQNSTILTFIFMS